MVLVMYGLILYYQKINARTKAIILQSDLATLRQSIDLFSYHRGQPPQDIRDLEAERFVEYKPGKILIKRSYIESIAKDAEGYPVDPFGKRYRYNPETGMVGSQTTGYENW